MKRDFFQTIQLVLLTGIIGLSQLPTLSKAPDKRGDTNGHAGGSNVTTKEAPRPCLAQDSRDAAATPCQSAEIESTRGFLNSDPSDSNR